MKPNESENDISGRNNIKTKPSLARKAPSGQNTLPQHVLNNPSVARKNFNVKKDNLDKSTGTNQDNQLSELQQKLKLRTQKIQNASASKDGAFTDRINKKANTVSVNRNPVSNRPPPPGATAKPSALGNSNWGSSRVQSKYNATSFAAKFFCHKLKRTYWILYKH